MFTLFTVAALFAGAFSTPTMHPTPNASPFVVLRTSTTFRSGTCINVPISTTPDCITFTGGLSVLNDAVGSAEILGGFSCKFFINRNCNTTVLSNDSFTIEALTTEIVDFSTVPGNFVNNVSSFNCALL